ncbi:STAS domain-containing protein [Cereibacter sphaeroides]|uniref:STAS domain-containing protein n=1 Tax=Rhodobacterales TaxID=204455 RepID=UPI000BBE988E|nr:MULTISPECIES: STAS domain-containing protein [Paracoccaceae]MCE6951815.1 STAS domain-containing protein [Cereibacter sphaeroides]MCE6960128.1 STAS domain-containing protein [Cereibacter sphaeroides]MCE6967910.1 STAS domain-containing protein [Cereibacter sphaeroides]MCE6971611.1 STAS domain-containing protein [Cereibacter sphaeroides]
MNPLRISGELRLQDASGLMLRLEEALTDGDVTLDVADVSDADVAVVQVFVSAMHTASLLGRTLTMPLDAAMPLAARLRALGMGPADLGGKPTAGAAA